MKISSGNFVESHLDKMDNVSFTSPEDWLLKFALVLQELYPAENYDKLIRNMTTVAVGYNAAGTPYLSVIKDGKVHSCNSGMLCNQNHIRGDDFFKQLNFKEAVAVLKEDIDKFVTDNHKFTDIGKNFTVATITEGGNPRYLENPNELCWNSFTEMKNFMSSNKDLLTPIAPFSERYITEVLT
ncbi:hypothetical protein [Zobellia nedashkovskayae]|uniref:hypothetical protein n=1 Tax=Zobellia nedashkovskayae TaxID=2779510 RepID=UPI00188D11BF|nr:hypothetical protein [Zobellia nedashkovskayae]